MEGSVRVNLGEETSYEKSLLAILNDILSLDNSEVTPDISVVENVSLLESYAKTFKVEKKKNLEDKKEFGRVKGEIIGKIQSKLENINKERFKIAKQQDMASILQDDE